MTANKKRNAAAGWIGAIAAGLAVWHYAIAERGIYTVDGRFQYTCGTVMKPAYPVDGLGPCTDAIRSGQVTAGVFAVIALIAGFYWLGSDS